MQNEQQQRQEQPAIYLRRRVFLTGGLSLLPRFGQRDPFAGLGKQVQVVVDLAGQQDKRSLACSEAAAAVVPRRRAG